MSASGPSVGYAAPGYASPPVDPAAYGQATYQEGQGWASNASAQGMFSPSFGPQRRYRRTTGDDGSAFEPAAAGMLGVNPMYQHPSGSAPSLDVAGNAPTSRGPPLADDLGSAMDKLSIGGNGAMLRSKTPAGSTNPAVERANAMYAQQEIYQSAAEVQPENSLAAIAHEVDQTASDIKQSAERGQTVVGSAEAHYPGVPGEQPPMAPAFDPAYGAGQPPPPAGGEWPPQDPAQAGYAASYTDGQASYYAQDPYGAYGAQQGYAPAHHQANGYLNAQGYGYDATYYAQQGYVDYGAAGSSAAGAAGYLGYGQEIHRPPSAASGYMAPPMGLNRQHTQLSMTSANSAASAARRKSKESAAIQQTLPYNKEFVDEYRQRMKGDPDPEAQFAFAKYLIEAAKKVSDPKDGPKQARKYRDNLLSESLKLVKRLATTGTGLGKPPYAEAQFFLANCFGNGSLGLQVDHEKAYNLYVQASKQNHPAATYRTAVCNEVGAGTRRDHHRAVLFYRKASALGDTAGMYKLGMILLNGLLGQPRNIREAIVWLKRAAGQADEDNPHALHELGLLHEKPNNSVVMHDEAYARELFTQAAQLGYAPSQFKLGSAYEYGSLTCPVDPRRSIAWYTKAAGKNDGESELALSGWYLTGSEGVLKQSDSEAYLWARRAATKGIPKAEYALGYYTEVGIGVQSNIEEAKRWYMRAAAQGNKRAMQRLTELKKMGTKAGKKGARPTRKDAESECVVM